LPLIILHFILLSCSFDYGSSEDIAGRPDIVMEEIEYVRVRGGDPIVRFRAEHGERWEDDQIMEVRDFTFEQFENDGVSIDAFGEAGKARIELGTGDVFLSGGISIRIESDDITIRTQELEWRDEERTLTGPPRGTVEVERSDGTFFSGRGFTAHAPSRTWEFSGEVRGTYVDAENNN